MITQSPQRESEVTQSYRTLRPHGLYSPWNSPGQNIGVSSFSLLQGIFPTQGSNPGLPHCRQILYQLSHKGSPRIGVGSLSLLQGIFPTQQWNWGLLHCRQILDQLTNLGIQKECLNSPIDTLILAQWDFLQNYKTIISCCFKLASLCSFLTAQVENQCTHLEFIFNLTARGTLLKQKIDHTTFLKPSSPLAAFLLIKNKRPTTIRSTPHPTRSTLSLLSSLPHYTLTMYSRLLLPSRPIGAHLFKMSSPQIFHIFLSQCFRSLLKCHLLSKTFPFCLI